MAADREYENIVQKTAKAWRIMGRLGLIDTVFNHISSAWLDEKGETTFAINTFGKLPSCVTRDDMAILPVRQYSEEDANKFKVNSDGLQLHSLIHSTRARAGVILHTHSPFVIAVSSTPHGLLPISQTAIEFVPDAQLIPYGGLFRTNDLTDEMKRLAINGGVALLRNHGALFIAESVEEAVYLAYYLDEACRIQCLSSTLTPTPILPPDQVVREASALMKQDRRAAASALFVAFEAYYDADDGVGKNGTRGR